MTFEKLWAMRTAFRCSLCLTKYTMDAMMRMHTIWVNNDERFGKVGVCNVCGKINHAGKWQIFSNKDIYRIFTTDLEMPMCPPSIDEDILESEYYIETMIQNRQDDSWLDFQARYKTREEAIEGHWLAYDNLEDILLKPDKYPQDIISKFMNSIKQYEYTRDKYTEKTKHEST